MTGAAVALPCTFLRRRLHNHPSAHEELTRADSHLSGPQSSGYRVLQLRAPSPAHAPVGYAVGGTAHDPLNVRRAMSKLPDWIDEDGD